jgi:hypothetical protein
MPAIQHPGVKPDLLPRPGMGGYGQKGLIKMPGPRPKTPFRAYWAEQPWGGSKKIWIIFSSDSRKSAHSYSSMEIECNLKLKIAFKSLG